MFCIRSIVFPDCRNQSSAPHADLQKPLFVKEASVIGLPHRPVPLFLPILVGRVLTDTCRSVRIHVRWRSHYRFFLAKKASQREHEFSPTIFFSLMRLLLFFCGLSPYADHAGHESCPWRPQSRSFPYRPHAAAHADLWFPQGPPQDHRLQNSMLSDFLGSPSANSFHHPMSPDHSAADPPSGDCFRRSGGSH